VALENFLSARTVVKQARSEFFPTVTAVPSVTRSRQSQFTSGQFSSTNNSASTLTEILAAT